MRTTITLDADVASLLERDMAERKVAFKTAVNDAIRQGLTRDRARVDIVFPAYDLGATLVDLTHATALAAALEDDALVAKLETGR